MNEEQRTGNKGKSFSGGMVLALRSLLFVFALTGLFLYTRVGVPERAHAAIPLTMNFQARLLTNGGAIVPDGYYNVQFKLYDASSGGTNVWTETWFDSNGVTAGNDNRIQVRSGYLSVYLGDQTAFGALDFTQQYWLTMNIGGVTQTATPTYDGEMNPRLRLTSVPYAQAATRSDNLDGIDSTGFAQLAPSAVQGVNSANTALRINQTGAGNLLQLQTGGSDLLTLSNAGVLTVTNAANFNGGLTVASGQQLTNSGSTLFTAVAITNKPTGGAIGTAAATVDGASTFNVNQTTSGQTLTLPTPTNTTAGRIVFVANVGSADFAMHGVTITNAKAQSFIWNGSAWVSTSIDGSGSGATSVGALDGTTKSANGGVITANQLFFQTADATYPGLVSTGSQTFAGAKTFNGQIVAGAGIDLVAQTIQGTTAIINFTNFDIEADGDIITAGDLAVNGGDITSTASLNVTASNGALTLTSTGASNDIVINSADTIELQDNTNITGTLGVSALATFSGGLTVTNGDQLTNAGSTLYSAVAITNRATGGNIGTAAATVDGATTFDINQTTAGQSITLPNPTDTTSGRIVFVNNVGSVSFEMYGSVIAVGKSNAFIWNGSAWVTTVSLSGSVVNTIGTIDSQTKSADGAVISGNAIYLQTADGTNVGLVSTGAQTFAGAKTFNGQIIAGAGISLSSQTIQGTTAIIDFTNFDVDASGNITTTGDINVNGDDITSDGNLTLQATGYVRIGDSGTPGFANGDDDLYIEGDLEVDGNADFAGNLVVAAQKTISLTGGTTAQRPGSLTEGMIYFDTDTDQLLIYANGKWQADRSEAILVAASNSSQAAKDSADYVADGNTGAAADGDQVQINAALTAAAAAGAKAKVYLFAGTYTVDAAVSVPSNITLSGSGAGTVITIPNSFNTNISIVTNANATNENITVQDLTIDGNKANQTSGSMNAISMFEVGSGSGTSAVPGLKATGLTIRNTRTRGIYISGAANSIITNNNLINNSISGGASIFVSFGAVTSDYTIISNNVIQGSGAYGIYIDGDNMTIDGNVIEGSATEGVYIEDNLNIVTNNLVRSSGGRGIEIDGSNNTVTGNTVSANASHGIAVGGGNNVISDNSIHDNGGTGANDGIRLDNTTADNNSITSNRITDTAGTGFAININASTRDNNYLADNYYSGTGATTINNAGTGTIFGGQLTGTNYTIQPAGTIELIGATNITGNLDVSGTLNIGSANQFQVSAAGELTFSGVAADITTGANEDLTVVANGTGFIDLNDTVRVGTLAAADTDSYVVCRDASSGQLSACDTNGSGDPFIQGGNSFGAAAVLGTNDAFDLQLETAGTTRLTIDQTGNLTFAQASTITTSAANAGLTVNPNGTGTLTLGNTGTASSIQVGNTTGAVSQSIYIGTNATASSTSNVTIGSTVAGTVTLQGVTTVDFNTPTAQFTEVTGTRTLTVQTRTTNVAGSNLTVSAGTAGAGGSAFSGGLLTLQGGLAGGTGNANGGDVLLQGGNGTGTGVPGVVRIDTPVFTASATQSFAANGTIAQSVVDGNSTIPINATAASLTITLPAPTNTTVGRIVYITSVTGSNVFTISPSGGTSFVMNANMTGTFVWNGTGWTNAGVDGGSASYIQNQTAVDQVANFRINGVGRASGFDINTSGTLNIGNGTTSGQIATTIQVGNDTNNSAITISSGTGAINVGTGAQARSINIGTGAAAQTLTFGSTNTTSSTTLQAGSGNINLNASQAQFSEVTGTRTLTVQTRTTNVAGSDLTVSAGTAGAGGSAFSGGLLTLQGGLAGGTGNANGGDVLLQGGTGTGTGVPGVVRIDTPVFTASATQSFAVTGTITQSIVDGNSTIPINATAASLTITLPAPTNTTVGRIIYVTVVNGSNSFTIAPSGGTSFVMGPNTTGTFVWNGSGWTNAGVDGGSASYIQNQNGADQTANFRISGTGQINTSLTVPLVQTAAGNGSAALTVQTGNVTGGNNVDSGALTLTTGGATAGNNRGSGGISIVSGSAQGNRASGSITIDAGTIQAGQGATTGTVSVGTTNASAVTVGNTTATLTLQAGAGNINLNASQAQFSEVTGTRTLTVQTRTTNVAGSALTVSGGTAGAGASAFTGGLLTLQGGNAGGTGNASGANVVIRGGTGVGTGVSGIVEIDTPVFTASATQAFGVNGTITQSIVDGNSTIPVNATTASLTITLPAPTNTTVGRIIYVTSVSGSNSFTIAPSGGTNFVMSPNMSGTFIWNGAGWTNAGVDGGSNSYVQNQNSVDQTANYRISGTGRANTSFQAPLYDTATAVALAIGTTNATAINLDQNTTIAATKTLTVTSGATVLTGATTGVALTVNNSTSTGNIANFQDNGATVFSIADGGNVTATGDLAVNGGDVTSTTSLNLTASNGAITLTSTGASNDIIFNSADTIELQDNTNVTGNLDASGTLNIGSANQFSVTASGELTFSGVATDITTGTNEDLTVIANGTGVINLNDTVRIGTLAAADTDSYVVCRDASSGQLSTCDANASGDPFIQGGNTFGATAVLGTNDSFSLELETAGTTKLTIDTSGNVGIGDTTPDAKLEVLATTEQLRLTYTDGTVDSRFTVDSSGNLNIDNTGTKTVITDDLQVTGNDLLDSAGTTRLTLGASNLFAGNVDISGTLFAGTSDAFQVAADGQAKFVGTATDITTGTNEDLTVVADGTGVINLNDTVRIGTLAATDTDSYALCRDASSGQLSACDANTTGRPFLQGGNTFGATAVLGTNDANSLALETSGTTRLVVDTSGNLAFQQASTISTTTGALTLAPVAGSNINITTSGTGDLVINTDQLYVDTSTGFIGIGDSTPDWKVDIESTTAATSGTTYGLSSALTVSPSSAPGAGAYYDGLGGLAYASGANINANVNIRGLTGTVANLSSNTLGSATGLVGQVFSAGNITTATGVIGAVVNSSTGTFTSATALNANSPFSSSGAITTAYGVYINTQDVAGVGTGYGVYQAGSVDLNLFAGSTTFANQVTLSGVATDITTGTNEDLTVVANGTGVINLNDSITAGGNITFATGANRILGVETQTTSNTAGNNLTVSAASGNGTGAGGILGLQGGIGGATGAGGAVSIQGGAAGGGNNNGGAVMIAGGAGTGTGTQGLVNLSTTAFSSAAVQTFASAGTFAITAGNVDLYSTLPVTASVTGVTVTVPDPNQSVIGRIVYISARSGSSDFTLRLNSTRTPIDIAMKANSTATLIWNGTDWTAAGASSSTDLQSAYNNTLTSAGGAEIVLNPSGGAADGFTIRNNGTTPISGGVLEVQTSIGTNLFSVNNLGTELAANGGAETLATFGTNWSDATPTGATVTRTTNASQYITGQAGVSVVTTATPLTGVKNNLSGNPVNTIGAVYQVSFAAKSSLNGSQIQVDYSRNGGTNMTTCSNYGTGTGINYATLSDTTWTKVTCTITIDSATAATDPDLFIRKLGATTPTIYIDNLSFIRNDTTTAPSNVQVGGGVSGGQVTLFTLDRSSAPPVAAGNNTYLGSMYFDTTTGRIQCYEVDGWGACGSAPDNIITLTPEYTGAVLNGTGIGTLTADFCANSVALTVGTLCGSGDARNFYRWTSPQATAQDYSIYVSYKLPSTFKEFTDANTMKLTTRSTDLTLATADLEVLRKASAGGITSCGIHLDINTTVNTWQQPSYSGNESTCGFTGGDYIIFRITVTAEDAASIYIENLDFTFTNK